jgi:hypothetical protein
MLCGCERVLNQELAAQYFELALCCFGFRIY